jgi:hypothetical protein
VGFGILWPWLVRTARFSAVLILNLAHKKEGIRALRENGAPVFIGGGDVPDGRRRELIIS